LEYDLNQKIFKKSIEILKIDKFIAVAKNKLECVVIQLDGIRTKIINQMNY